MLTYSKLFSNYKRKGLFSRFDGSSIATFKYNPLIILLDNKDLSPHTYISSTGNARTYISATGSKGFYFGGDLHTTITYTISTCNCGMCNEFDQRYGIVTIPGTNVSFSSIKRPTINQSLANQPVPHTT